MPDIDSTPIAVPYSLADVAPYLHAKADSIMSGLDNLARQLAPMADTWQSPPGSAAPSYEQLQAQWNLAARQLFGDVGDDGLLGQIARVMGINYDNYLEGASVTTNVWRN